MKNEELEKIANDLIDCGHETILIALKFDGIVSSLKSFIEKSNRSFPSEPDEQLRSMRPISALDLLEAYKDWERTHNRENYGRCDAFSVAWRAAEARILGVKK